MIKGGGYVAARTRQPPPPFLVVDKYLQKGKHYIETNLPISITKKVKERAVYSGGYREKLLHM
jgi:hypothetical protein